MFSMRFPKPFARNNDSLFDAALRGIAYAFGWTCGSFMFERKVHWEIVSILIVVPIIIYGLRMLIDARKRDQQQLGFR